MEELRDQISALQNRVREKEQELIVIQQDLNMLKARLEDALSEKRVEELKAEQEERLRAKAKEEAELARLAAEQAEKAAQAELEAAAKREAEAAEKEAASEEVLDANKASKEEIEITQVNEAQHEAIMRTIEEMSTSLGISKGDVSEGQFQDRPTLGDKVSRQRINDIKRGIGINERFLYANELFAGDMSAFSQAVEELNHVDTESDANRLLDENLALKYRWDNEDETVLAFKTLVSRRFA